MINVPLPSTADLPSAMRDCPHWIIWRAEEREGKIAKVPVDQSGITASMKESHLSLSDAIEAAFKLRDRDGPCYGVGIAFTDGIGIVGVDLDNSITDGIASEKLRSIIDYFGTWGEASVSETGAHLFFRGSFARKKTVMVDGQKFEIFGTVGFIAVTGNVIHHGDAADFAPFAEFIEPYLKATPTTNGHASTYEPAYHPMGGGNPYGRAALENQCGQVRAAIPGTLHYTLCRCATSLGRLVPLYLSFEEAESALYAATVDAGGKDMSRALRTIRGQLEFGMTDPASPDDRIRGVDLSGFMGGASVFYAEGSQPPEEKKPSRLQSRIEDPGPFPEKLLAVRGVLGEICEHTNQTSHRLQPVLALGGAICLLSTLIGRKVKDENGARPNVYVVGVAGSGFGKDASRETNKHILFHAGADCLIGPEGFNSGSSVVSAIHAQPTLLIQNDEFGRVLRTLGASTAAAHLQGVITNLLRLYTSSATIFKGDAYADPSKNMVVDQPSLTLYGSSTVDEFYASLSPESVSGGLLGRCFIFEGTAELPDYRKCSTSPAPESIITFARRWAQFQTSGNLGAAHPSPIEIQSTPEARDIIGRFAERADNEQRKLKSSLSPIWSRAIEKANKLALIHACSFGVGSEAEIDGDSAEWACELVEYLTKRMIFVANGRIAENRTESTIQRILRLIDEAGEISQRELTRATRYITVRERNDAIQNLIDSDDVQMRTEPTSGRPVIIFTIKRQ